jgi:hypothetical protein
MKLNEVLQHFLDATSCDYLKGHSFRISVNDILEIQRAVQDKETQEFLQRTLRTVPVSERSRVYLRCGAFLTTEKNQSRFLKPKLKVVKQSSYVSVPEDPSTQIGRARIALGRAPEGLTHHQLAEAIGVKNPVASGLLVELYQRKEATRITLKNRGKVDPKFTYHAVKREEKAEEAAA